MSGTDEMRNAEPVLYDPEEIDFLCVCIEGSQARDRRARVRFDRIALLAENVHGSSGCLPVCLVSVVVRFESRLGRAGASVRQTAEQSLRKRSVPELKRFSHAVFTEMSDLSSDMERGGDGVAKGQAIVLSPLAHIEDLELSPEGRTSLGIPMKGWLTGWLVGWLAGWLVGWLLLDREDEGG
ncbi:hypothetical protein V1477_015446 [Vespula maculifrons]|uniref:Uncharacterized protein n=1 Tax=Vespula maculifrons TaxID=7453 RepID=A0ABD2BFV7_VESMC